VLAGTAIGAIVTMVTGREPGTPLGVFVVAGTIAAALAVRPSAGRMIIPVPALSYLAAALGTGIIHDRAAGSSGTAFAVRAVQWIASGFFAIALATILAAVLTVVRWYLRRRGRRPAGSQANAPADPPAGSAWAAPAAGRDATGPRRTTQPAVPQSPGPGPGPAPGSGRTGPQPPPRSRGPNPYNFSSGA
jgi:hypothetical protein